MKKLIFTIAFLFVFKMGWTQPNCNVYKWNGDTLQYEACKLSEKFDNYYQFDTRGLAILDSCLTICPYYAWAHYEIAVVYLKAGNFIGWDKYMKDAIKYDAENYLGNRASCRAKFFADYKGAIHDIDSLESIVDYDIGFIHNGAYHLIPFKALCYKTLGNFEKAIEILENFMSEHGHNVGLYDYIHLGVCYQKTGKHEEALSNFKKQELHNDQAENHFYSALSYKALGDLENYNASLEIAKEKLLKKQKMNDPYHVLEDEIFLSDIEALLK